MSKGLSASQKLFLVCIALIFVLVILSIVLINQTEQRKAFQKELSDKQALLETNTQLVAHILKTDELLKSITGGKGGLETPVAPVVKTPGFVFPMSPDEFVDFSSPWGIRESPFSGALVFHEGLDLFGIWKAQILSVADGIVREHYLPPDGVYKGHPIYGGTLLIEHADGVFTRYAHLSETFVHEGENVTAGQVIARQGSNGLSDGEHLHIEVIINGENVNPIHYLQ